MASTKQALAKAQSQAQPRRRGWKRDKAAGDRKAAASREPWRKKIAQDISALKAEIEKLKEN